MGGPLIEHYSGGAWAAVASPAFLGALSAISCPTADECWAVGDEPSQLPDAQSAAPVIEHYSDGVWAIATGPALSASGELTGISCPTASSCWAVGDSVSLNPAGPAMLIEQYSSGAWTVATLPTVQGGALQSVACPTADDCWAVGGQAGNANAQALILHYAGDGWSADGFTTGMGLSSVTCISADDCWAAGIWAVGSMANHQPLAARYSGSGWAVVDTPPIASGGQLEGVTCDTEDDCWAVGSILLEFAFGQPLVEHFDGSGWTVVGSPTVEEGAALYGAAFSGPGNCWAVGYSGGQYDASGGALIETNT